MGGNPRKGRRKSLRQLKKLGASGGRLRKGNTELDDKRVLTLAAYPPGSPKALRRSLETFLLQKNGRSPEQRFREEACRKMAEKAVAAR